MSQTIISGFGLGLVKWDRIPTGRAAYALIREAGSKTLFPEVRCCGISNSRLLLDDTVLKAHQYRMGLVQSGVCECGQGIDDEYQYFFTCPKYNGIRDELLVLESVKEIFSSKCEGSESLQLTTSLLLAPGSQDGISKGHSREILSATFDFILKSGRCL